MFIKFSEKVRLTFYISFPPFDRVLKNRGSVHGDWLIEPASETQNLNHSEHRASERDNILSPRICVSS